MVGTSLVRCMASDYALGVREIWWTDKSEDHSAAHNVTPGEVEQVLCTRPRLASRISCSACIRAIMSVSSFMPITTKDRREVLDAG